MSQSKVTKAIFPVAGMGTRLIPASKNVPKELVSVVNRPAVEYIVGEMVDAGIQNMILITSKHKGAIVDHFDRNHELEQLLLSKNKHDLLQAINKFRDVNFVSIRQPQALGLGHAIYMAKPILRDEFFVVSLPDMLVDNGSKYIRMMCDIAEKTGQAVIALMEVPRESVSSYGVVDGETNPDGTIKIRALVEKPPVDQAPSNLAILGRYVLPYRVMEILEHVKPDATGEIQLTSALQVLAKESGMIGIVIREEIHDIGSPLGFVQANIYYGMKDKRYCEQIKQYVDKLQCQSS